MDPLTRALAGPRARARELHRRRCSRDAATRCCTRVRRCIIIVGPLRITFVKFLELRRVPSCGRNRYEGINSTAHIHNSPKLEKFISAKLKVIRRTLKRTSARII